MINYGGEMRKIIYNLILLFATSIIAIAEVPISLQKEFQEIIENAIINQGVKGISACVILPDNSIWTGQAGTNGSGEEITDTTVFYGGSTTKTFVATRVLQLWESGLINLDSAYTSYIDTINYVDPETTIRQMLNHTSGIYDVDQHPKFFLDLLNSPSHFYTPEEILEKYLNHPHNFSPGTNYEYSNSNYLILGTIIEAITGNPLAEELRNNIFDVIDTKHTYFSPYEIFSEPHCGLWMYNESNLMDLTNLPQTSLLSIAFSAGNITTYPLDEAIFIRELVNGNILSTVALSQMLTMNNFSNDYGLGIVGIEIGEDTLLYGHNGVIGNLTEMYHSPQLNLTVVVMQNSENGDSQPFNYLFLRAWRNVNTSIVDKSIELGEILISPNPASEYIELRQPPESFEPLEGSEIKIFNTFGELVFSDAAYLKEVPHLKRIDISHLPIGLYFIQIGKYTEKFMVLR